LGHGDCCVAPHPELRKRWAAELEKAKQNSATTDAAALGLARKPRRRGFDDDVIIPPNAGRLGVAAEGLLKQAADRAPLRGTVRVIVVLVDFSDKPATATQQHLNDLFFSTGVLPKGSVREYYTEVTNGLVVLDGAVVGPYRMPQTLAWYANNNSGIGKGGGAFRSPQLALDAVTAADAAVNFSPYDNDGNGFVDAFIVVHAGPGAEVSGSSSDIWSHKSTLSTAYGTDGTQIFGYLTIPEDARIGVCAHELGHLLFGFPDLYDTDYTSEGIGNWCLMAGGSWNDGGDRPAHPSAWCKANQGWVAVTSVIADGPLTVPQVETSHQVFRAWKAGASGSEYFLLENRQLVGYDAALPGAGLLVWHIDESQTSNTDETHYKVGLLEADGKRDLELAHNRGDGGDPYPGTSNSGSLTGSTTPNTKSYAGQDTCVAVTNIPPSSASMTVNVKIHCGKLKDAKDGHKDHKELKEFSKDFKEQLKDAKEHAKEGKELKEHPKEGKELKEHSKDFKELKEHAKEGKEFSKDLKELKEAVKEFKELGPEGPGGHGAGGDPFGFGFGSSQATSNLEARVAALEVAMRGGTAAPFIDSSLRPALVGGQEYAKRAALLHRMAAGDALAKREFDTPVG
jgi:immune inhibitor A